MRPQLLLLTSLSAALLLAPPLDAAQGTDNSKASKTTEPRTPTSTHELANAKSQGLVWVNPSTRAYYKDGPSYGKGKRGKFMTEKAAIKAGFHEAKEPAASKKTRNKRERDQSGIDATIETHSPTPPKP